MRGPRRALFGLIALVFVLAFVELLAFCIHTVVFGGFFSFEDAQQERLRLAGVPAQAAVIDRPRDQDNDNNAQAIHPYLGYVLDPRRTPLWPVNDYGFIGELPPFRADEEGDSENRPVSVVVVGGSVAETLSTFGRGPLHAALAGLEVFAGREVRVSSLAIRGMKQPQQLMIVDWFQSLGARFDVVINLDGFNEILVGRENSLQGTFPFYPRRWKMRFEGIHDPSLLERAGRLLFLERLRTSLAERVAESPVRWSVTGNVVWELCDRGLDSRIVRDRGELNEALLDREAVTRTYDASGPARKYESAEARYRDLAAYWMNTSILLQKKAEAYGFRYFHFLQPNQYVADSKPMGPEEREIALPPSYFYRQGATEGYPYLIAAGREMTALGMPFTDLTPMFQGVEEPLYSDACCHFNARGNELIAQEIARVVGAGWAATPALGAARAAGPR